jgi:uncharacterized protein (TIGR03437 family)
VVNLVKTSMVLRSITLLVLLSACAYPATLSIPDQTANPGQTVATSVLLAAGGAAIAGIQFDLQWDQGINVQVASGSTLGQAYKVLYTAFPAPRSLRCLMVGVNLNSLPDGAVIDLFISADSLTSPGIVNVNLLNVVATDGMGEPVPLQPMPATVLVQQGTTLALPAGSVLNGASLLKGPVEPGEIITVLGSFSTVPPTLLIGGVAAPLLYVGTGQINAVVPFGVASSGTVDLQIRSQNQIVAEQSIPVSAFAPAIFTQTGTGTGPGAILNQDYSLNAFLVPAPINSILMVYGTGFGPLQSAVADGQAIGSAILLTGRVTATIGGVAANVSYAGSAPGLIAGLVQVNVQVPAGLPANPYTPITLSVGSATTQLGVTVSIQ